MLYDIVKVSLVSGYNLSIKFENGVEGIVDVSQLVPFEGVFADLKNIDFFSTVHVNSDIGTIVWDNGADISPTYLYSVISKQVA